MKRALWFAALTTALTAPLAGSACNPFNPSFQQPTCGPSGECPGELVCSEGVCVADPDGGSVCGDGFPTGDEVCDDGNTAEGDRCDATCKIAFCYVPSSHATATLAIADPACHVVKVSSGTYAERLAITRDVEIVGVGVEPVIFDGDAAGSVISVEAAKRVALRDLTIQNGSADEGGGIQNKGALVLERVTVRDNTASSRGGGLVNVEGSVTLRASHVIANHMTGTSGALSGAGIFSIGGSVRLEAQSTVEGNQISVVTSSNMTIHGGGIAANETELTLAEGSSVSGNTLFVDSRPRDGFAQGGGVWISGGSLTVDGSSISGNTVTNHGGFLVARNPPLLSFAIGGGFYASQTTVTLRASAVRENRVLAQADGTARGKGGGGFLVNGALTSTATVIVDNEVTARGGEHPGATQTSADGGGLALEDADAALTTTWIGANEAEAGTVASATTGAAFGGGLDVRLLRWDLARTLTFTSCTIDGNLLRSLDGGASSGGVHAAAMYGKELKLDFRSSTISNNQVQGATESDSGGIRAYTGAYLASIKLELINSTISGNRVTAPAGATHGGIRGFTAAADSTLIVALANATITDNVVTSAGSESGGISIRKLAEPSTVTATIHNSIIAGNSALTDANCNAYRAALTSHHNLVESLGSCSFSGLGDRIGPADLAPLAENGGPTRTHALMVGSQAIDNGDPYGCRDPSGALLFTDQRGAQRPSGARCDIGAYER